jgi:multidrug efflux pump subunit AcrB
MRIVLRVLPILAWLIASASWAAPPTVVNIVISRQGQSASEIDSQIAGPLAYVLNTEGVKQLEIESRAGRCSAAVYFSAGTDRYNAMQTVFERLNKAKPLLPADCAPATFDRSIPGELPRYWIAVRSNRFDQVELSDIAGPLVRWKIAQLAGVGKTQEIGAARRVATLSLEPTKLTAMGLTADDVHQAIIDASGQSQQPQPTARNENHLGDVIVRMVNGAPVRASDVGRFEDVIRQDGMAEIDGNRAVFVAVWAGEREPSNTAVGGEMARIRATLPPNVQVDLAADLSRDSSLLIEAHFPPDASPQKAREQGREIGKIVRAVAGCSVLQFRFDETDVLRLLIPRVHQPVAISEFRSRLSNEIPGVKFRFSEVGGKNSLTPFPVRMALVGLDPVILRRWSDATVKRLSAETLASDLQAFPGPDVPGLKIVVDRDAAARAGISMDDLSEKLKSVKGTEMTFTLPNGKPAEIRLPAENVLGDRLKQASIKAANGDMIPLSAIARITSEAEPSAVVRVGPWPAILIAASPPPGVTTGDAVKKLLAAASAEREKLGIPAEYNAVDLVSSGD